MNNCAFDKAGLDVVEPLGLLLRGFLTFPDDLELEPLELLPLALAPLEKFKINFEISIWSGGKGGRGKKDNLK